MAHKKFWVLAICLGIFLMTSATAFAGDDMNKDDLKGISPQNHKYIFSVLGGTAAGAGLGFLLGGGAKVGKLMMLGGGGTSTWYLHTHRNALGEFHNWAMIGSGTVLGGGIGWTICDCDHGLIGGLLIGGGGTAVWEALKNDSAARQTAGK